MLYIYYILNVNVYLLQCRSWHPRLVNCGQNSEIWHRVSLSGPGSGLSESTWQAKKGHLLPLRGSCDIPF